MRLETMKDGSIDMVRDSAATLPVYVFWHSKEALATLDGRFTAEELELIAAHMREHRT